MNRTIKFRGKRVDNGKWVFGHLLPTNEIRWSFKDESTGFFTVEDHQVLPETVGQFTGLNDKNGKEIYEGDILVDQGGTSGIVSWNKDDCSFSVNWHDDLFESLYYEDSEYFEITGNIHDND